MALIKKQIFRPSKDENLQQFLAKDHGENMEMKWGQPSSKDKPNTQARKKGLIRGLNKPSEEYDMETMEGQDAYERDSEAAGFNKPSPKSEPKSPWDDESDALDPRTKINDQGSDNSNSADDRTKEIKNAVQDAWFEKGKYMSAEEQADFSPEELAEHAGGELTSVKPGTLSGRAGRSPSKQAAMKDADSNRRAGQTPYFYESKGRRKDNEIAAKYQARKPETSIMEQRKPADTPKKDPNRVKGGEWKGGKWISNAVQDAWFAVQDAWFEKARSRRNQEKVGETREQHRGVDSPRKWKRENALTRQTLDEERDWQSDPYRPSLDLGETEGKARDDARHGKTGERHRRRRYRKHQGDTDRDITTQVANPDRKSLSEYGNKRTKKLVDRVRREQRSPEARAKREDANKTDTLKNRQNYSPSDQYHHDVKQQRRKDKGIVVDQRKVTSRQMHGDQPFTPRRMSEWPKKQAE